MKIHKRQFFYRPGSEQFETPDELTGYLYICAPGLRYFYQYVLGLDNFDAVYEHGFTVHLYEQDPELFGSFQIWFYNFSIVMKNNEQYNMDLDIIRYLNRTFPKGNCFVWLDFQFSLDKAGRVC